MLLNQSIAFFHIFKEKGNDNNITYSLKGRTISMQNAMPENPEPFWRDSIELPTFPKLEESMKVDVGIVGGGITGITTAYLLSKQNLSVALLDAGVILNGTTGHTTAKEIGRASCREREER